MIPHIERCSRTVQGTLGALTRLPEPAHQAGSLLMLGKGMTQRRVCTNYITFLGVIDF